MALRHVRPDETLNRELLDVARDSDALLEYLRAPNAIPDTFPTSQLVEICKSLSGLPQGTAEGCRVPLEYARVRLPAIRREHFLNEDHVGPLADQDEAPPLLRGMGLDRLLKDLIASVTTAFDEYRRQVTEHFDDTVGPEPVVDVPDDANIRAAVAKSESVETALGNAGDQIRAATDPGSSRADRLLRTMKDAEGLNRLARAELGTKIEAPDPDTIMRRSHQTSAPRGASGRRPRPEARNLSGHHLAAGKERVWSLTSTDRLQKTR